MIPAAMAKETASAAPRVALIILNWNNAPDTLECLASVRKISYEPFFVIVVDNGSRDNSAEAIAAAHPEVTLLRIRDNCGFCAANNAGLEEAVRRGADAFVLLNNDTVVDPGILQGFVAAASAQPAAGFLGAKTYFHSAPRTIWHGFTRWDPSANWYTHIGHGVVDCGQPEFSAVQETFFANGCALYLRRELLDAIGGLDPRFFCYMDEMDWCQSAIEKGYRNYYVPEARVWHKVSSVYGGVNSPEGGANSPIKNYFRTRNTLLWAHKHLPVRARFCVLRRLLGELLRPGSWRGESGRLSLKRIYWSVITIRRTPALLGKFYGIRDYFLRRFGDCPRETQKLLGFAAAAAPAP